MSIPDDMGLTPEAARGYESYFVPAIFGQWPPVFAELAKLVAGEDVLDVGCGTGVFTREAVRVVGSTGSVTGVDLSESMLAVASEISPTGRFKRCNVMDLPFDNSSFDVAVASFVLMFVPEPTTALKEMARVLRPGGRLVIGVWEGLGSNAIYTELVKIVSEVVDESAGESIAWPFSLGAEGVLEKLLQKADLSSPAITTHAGTAKFPSVSDFVKTEIQSWLLAESVTASDIDEIVIRAEVAFERCCNAAGVMEFPFNARVALYKRPQ